MAQNLSLAEKIARYQYQQNPEPWRGSGTPDGNKLWMDLTPAGKNRRIKEAKTLIHIIRMVTREEDS